jgi:hypothetical protein
VPFVKEKKHSILVLCLPVFRQGEAARTLHQICTKLVTSTMLWFQEHLPRYLLHCLSLFTPCASDWKTNNLIKDYMMNLYIAFLDVLREKRHALTRSMHRLKADAMPVGWRSPALRFQLRSPHHHQASSSSTTERTSPSYWVGTTPIDGWSARAARGRAVWASMGSNTTGLMAGITLACQQPH